MSDNALFDAISQATDLAGLAEFAVVAGGSKFSPATESILKPLSAGISGYNAINGGYNLIDGVTGDTDGEQAMHGVHDLLTGGGGLASLATGPVGAAGMGLGAGMTLGDLFAPTMFGSEEEWREKGNRPDADGKYHATSGNDAFDDVLHFFGM